MTDLMRLVQEDILNHVLLIQSTGTDSPPEDIIKFAISIACLSKPEYASLAFFKTNEGVVKYNPVLVSTLIERLQFEDLFNDKVIPIPKNVHSLPSIVRTDDPISPIFTTRYRRMLINNIVDGIAKNLQSYNISIAPLDLVIEEVSPDGISNSWVLNIIDRINPNFDYLGTVIGIFSTEIKIFCQLNNISNIIMRVDTVDDYANRQVGWTYRVEPQ